MNYFTKLTQKITPVHKSAFFTTIVVGLATYMFTITHRFMTYDSLWNVYSDQDILYLARQFLTYACGISSFYDLPWLNGILAILYIAVSAVLVVELFEIKDKVLAGIIGAVMITFPSVIATFCYTYTVDGYMLAVLLGVLALLVTHRYKWGFIPGIALLGFSIGIYQAYYSLVIVLCIFVLLRKIYKSDDIKDIIIKAVRYLVMGVGAYAFYVVTLKLMLAIKKVDLTGYQGTDKVTGVDFSNIIYGLKTALYKFFTFAAYENVLTTFEIMKYALIGIVLCTGIMFIYLFIKNRAYKRWYLYILTALLVAIIPFGATIVAIMAPDNYFHTLMRYAWVVFFIFGLVEFNDMCLMNKIHKFWLWIGRSNAILTVVMVFCFMVVANIVAFQMNERYEKTYAICLRMVDRLEQTPGYQVGDKVAMLGGNLSADNYPETAITKKDLVGYFGQEGDLCVNSSYKFMMFCKHYLGVTIVTIPEDEQIELTINPEFMEMDNFPSENSIRKIGDVWVIRING